MTDKQRKCIRIVYHLLVTVALITAALCLMVACVRIYRTGDHPFTREVVAAAFAPIAVPVYLCLALVAIGFILHPLLPEPPATTPDRDEVTLRRLQSRLDAEDCPAETLAAARSEQWLRGLYRKTALAFFAIGSAVFLWYALDVKHFHPSEINTSMIRAMWVMLPCVGGPFLYGVFAAYQRRRSIRRELALLRPLPAVPQETIAAKSDRTTAVLRSALLVLGVGAVLYGALSGGWLDVLTKAINICTECIGLG